MTHNLSSRFLPPADFISDEKLQLAINFAQSLVDENNIALAHSLQGIGDIELPDISTTHGDLSALKPLAPLYLAFELEQAGVLVTAEKIAGLYFSGAINQGLGEAENNIMRFWSNRHDRLNQQERTNILEQAFEVEVFYPLFFRLCQAILALADNTQRNFQEEVGVDILLQQLREYFFSRPLGMISYAAEDILASITAALAFMKQKQLLTAFGVHSFWDLLNISGETTTHSNRQYAEMASAGMHIINWLTSTDAGQLQFSDPAQSQLLFSAAQRWILAYNTLVSYLNRTNSDTNIPAREYQNE